MVEDEPFTRRETVDLPAEALRVAPARFPPRWMARVTGSIGETLGRSQRISNR